MPKNGEQLLRFLESAYHEYAGLCYGWAETLAWSEAHSRELFCRLLVRSPRTSMNRHPMLLLASQIVRSINTEADTARQTESQYVGELIAAHYKSSNRHLSIQEHLRLDEYDWDAVRIALKKRYPSYEPPLASGVPVVAIESRRAFLEFLVKEAKLMNKDLASALSVVRVISNSFVCDAET